MNSSVCVWCVCVLLCLETVAAIICRRPSSKPKIPVQESTATTDPWYFNTEPPAQVNKPSTEKPGFENLTEGKTLNIDCESIEYYHQWFQGYQNSTSKKQVAIGNIPLQTKVQTTRYIITVEKFDENTVIYCKNDSDTFSDEDGRRAHDAAKKPLMDFGKFLNTDLEIKYFKTRIHLVDDEAPHKIEVPTILPYSEKKETLFNCEEYAEEKNYTFVGVINTTSNIIKTYKTISAHQTFNKTHNGTVLCCIYYYVSETAGEKWITRHVAKKTLLLYDETVQDLDSLEEMANTGTETGNHTTTIYITAAVAGVLLLLVTTVVCKKRCRKKPMSDSKVLYVDLDLLRNVQPDRSSRPNPEEESPYAQIVGVLKPDQ